jgi:hypothetical protein
VIGGLGALRAALDGDGVALDDEDDDLLGADAYGLSEAEVGCVLDREGGRLRVHGRAQFGEGLGDAVGREGVIRRRQLREDAGEQQHRDDQQAERAQRVPPGQL